LDGFGSFNGKVARGELIRKLWKALRWEEIEQHASKHAVSWPSMSQQVANADTGAGCLPTGMSVNLQSAGSPFVLSGGFSIGRPHHVSSAEEA
jgi:dihydroorotase-like cyclic amidohydrolase